MNARLLSLMALLIVSGCAGGSLLTSTEPRQTIYTLQPALHAAPSSPVRGDARIVEIAKPSVPPGFDGNRIALYLEGGRRLDYFAAARWSAPLDDLVQEFTRRTLPDSLPSAVTVTPGQSVQANYRLQIKLNEFQPVYERDQFTNPVLKAEVEFTLIRLPDEQIISSFILRKSGRANANALPVIAVGLEKMLQEIESEAFLKIKPLLKSPARGQ